MAAQKKTTRPIFLAMIVGCAAAVAQGLLWPLSATAHGRGLDGNGCHNDRQRGGYHCHRGLLSGESFRSESEAAAALRARSASPTTSRAGLVATAPTAPSTLAAVSSPSGSQTSGTFVSYDRQFRSLSLKDAIGTMFQFAIRDDTMIGVGERADDYFELNAPLLPWKVGQQIVVTWRPSADKQKRVAVATR
jgi:hypothetical protein